MVNPFFIPLAHLYVRGEITWSLLGVHASESGPLRDPNRVWSLSPRHEDLRPSRRGVTSSQGLLALCRPSACEAATRWGWWGCLLPPRWGLNGCVFCCRGCARLRLATPLPIIWSPLTGLYVGCQWFLKGVCFIYDLVAPNGAVYRVLMVIKRDDGYINEAQTGGACASLLWVVCCSFSWRG